MPHNDILKESDKTRGNLCRPHSGNSSKKSKNKKIKVDTSFINEQLYNYLVDNITEGVGIYEKNGILKYVNNSLCRMLGYSQEELIGQLVTQFMDNESIVEYEKCYKKLKKGTSHKVNLVFLSKEGQKIPTSIFAQSLFKKDKFVGFFAVITRLSEHKKFLKALQESEEKYRNIVERANEGIGIIQDYVFKYANNSLAKIFDHNKSDLIGFKFSEFIAPEEKEKFKNIYKKRMQGEKVKSIYESSIVSNNGHKKIVEINAGIFQYEGKNADLIFIRDVTERKQIDQALIESERKYRALQNNIPLGLYRSNPEGRFISANPATIRLFGYESYEELEKVSIVDIYAHKNDRVWLLESLNKNRTLEGAEVELLRKDGTTFWASISSTTVYDENENPIYYDGIIYDISEKKYAEEALKESEEKFRLISEQSLMAIAILQNGLTKYFNQAFCELSGYSQEEIKNWQPNEYLKTVHPEDLRMVLKKGREILTAPRAVANRFTFRGITKNGKIKFVDNYSKIIQFEGKPSLLMSLIDISEQKFMEDEIQKTQKLESTGLLAGGIAHDFNNRLSVILGNAQLARMNIEKKDKVENYLYNIESSAAQATSLTQQLLTFSKGGKPIKSICSIQEIIQEAISLSLSGSSVSSTNHFAEKLWNVLVDKGQITQVINNLLINAEQAMPVGGNVDIFVENYFFRKNDSPNYLQKGIYIKITIQDYGVGIPQKIIGKIFDPYFTTKQKGSGLGLSVAYSIIENHNGYIRAESEFGKGTKFFIYLPATRSELKGKVTVNDNSGFGSGKILVMDDEEFVLDMVCDLLKRTGFNALKAKDGHEAIQYYSEAQKNREPFNAVIMDLTIPGGMGGKDTITELKKIDPNVKAIVSSGYSNDPIMSNFKDYGFAGVIAKPYKLNKLHEVLHQVILEK